MRVPRAVASRVDFVLFVFRVLPVVVVEAGGARGTLDSPPLLATLFSPLDVFIALFMCRTIGPSSPNARATVAEILVSREGWPSLIKEWRWLSCSDGDLSAVGGVRSPCG